MNDPYQLIQTYNFYYWKNPHIMSYVRKGEPFFCDIYFSENEVVARKKRLFMNRTENKECFSIFGLRERPDIT